MIDRSLFAQLNRSLQNAVTVPFDDRAKIIFLSDSHRGDGGRSDAFVRNKGLFLHALKSYFDRGYTYIEVGDGDELWKNSRFKSVRQAHRDVYDLLHRFADLGRFHMITGNHDTRNRFELDFQKDGLHSRESLLLEHRESGQTLFVTHGHQVDITSSWMHWISQWSVQTFLRWSQSLGMVKTEEQPSIDRTAATPKNCRVEARLQSWVTQRRIPLICGHTHAPFFSTNAKTPYFNTGACIFEDYMTGIELDNGCLQMVRWSQQPDRSGRLTFTREVTSAGLPLQALR